MKIKICTSKKCAENGAKEILEYAEKELKNIDNIKIKKTGCLGICGKGIAVQIDDEAPKLKDKDKMIKKIEKLKNNGID